MLNQNGESWFRKNIVAVIGFALNLVVLGTYIGRQQQLMDTMERRVTVVEQRMTSHHEDANMHTSAEWRGLVLNSLNRLESKIDAHILIGSAPR